MDEIIITPPSANEVLISVGQGGAQGPAGPQGAGYDGVTSNTSQSIGLGSKTFALSTTLGYHAFIVGQRVRAVNSVGSYMEGLITAVSSSSMTINVLNIVGSGTYSSWSFGIAGTPGTDGTGGGGGTGTGYTHTQNVSASVWLVTHNLGYNPNVTTVTASGDVIEGDTSWTSLNTLSITFSSALSGVAYLS